jgi:hypothetical protein
MSLGFLLPACLGFLVFDILRRLKVATHLRDVVLIEALIAGIAVAAATEFLSLFQALTTGSVLIFWIVVSLILNTYRKRLPPPEPLNLTSCVRGFLQGLGWDGGAMILIIALFAFTLGLVALVATPNNYDSMTYHLARMGHWMQNQSIAFYGTNIARQNFMPPWAEWAMLQLTLLQGNDRLVNLVQWLSYCGCMIGASVITELLGGSRRDGVIAAFFVGTLPGAVFESTSTQNDLVLSFWLICCVYACMKLSLQPGWPATLVFGSSLGLAFLTKTVTAIFAAPLCLWALWALSRMGREKAFKHLAGITLLGLALNAGYFSRNLATSGHLLGPPEHDKIGGNHYTNDTFSPSAIFSNILRNASLHANLFHEKSIPEATVIEIHRELGIDPNDPRTTFDNGTFSIWEGGDDGTPMLLHLLTVLLCSGFLVWKRKRFSFLPFAVLVSVLGGALLFCIILKWQPFHARLHLALFIMSAPLVGLVLGSFFWRIFSLPILLSLLIPALPDVYLYVPRAVFGPYSVFTTPSNFEQLFRQPQLVQPYLEALQILDYNQVHEVGLVWKQDDWEYPLQTIDHVPVSWRVDHVLIENAYAPLETTLVPDAVLCTRPGMGSPLTIHGQVFKLVRVYETPDHEFVLSIYTRDGFHFQLPP